MKRLLFAAALAATLHDTHGWDAVTPSLGQTMEL